MSNFDSTAVTVNPLYVNNFIGTTPSETSERLLQGLAALSEFNFASSLSTGAALGVWHIVESLRMAAHHLVMELHDSSDPDPVEVDLNDADAASHLKGIAERMGCTVEEAAGYAVERGLGEKP